MRAPISTILKYTTALATLVTATAVPSLGSTQEMGEALQVEEILVTARKRTERLQEVPISANIHSGENLIKSGVANLERMSSYVPNLTIQPSPGVPSLYIRGIGSGPNNPSFEPSVGLFVDGIYLGRGRQSSGDFLDIARIEVLRGPQGALFGKNTSSGAINITSNSPTDAPEFSLTMTGYVDGDTGADAIAVASGPLSDTLKARIAVRYDNRDGWLSNTEKGGKDPGRERLQGRLTLAYEPSDTVSFELKANAFDYTVDGDFFASAPFGGDIDFTRESTGTVDEKDSGKGVNIGLTTNVEFGGGYTFTAITGYSTFDYLREVDSDFMAPAIFKTEFGEDFWQFSQEIRVTSPIEDRFNWVAGAYAHRAESDNILARSYITFAPLDGIGTRSMDQTTSSYSAYAQGSFNFTENWRLTAGLRATYEKKKASFIRFNEGDVPGNWLTTDLFGTLSETAVDPSVQLQYISGPSMFYASFAKGSKAGGFVAASTAVTQDGFIYDGETSESFELGTKLDLFDRRAQLNIAVFHTKYKDLQVSAWDPQANATLTKNAADATSKGIEVELAARIAEPLTFTGSFGYLDAKYDEFPGALCLYPETGVCDIAGARIPRSPKYSATGAFDFKQPISASLKIDANLTVSYRSAIFLDDNQNPASRQGGYAKIDARIGLGSISETWEVALIGQNLTDKLTASYALGTPFVVDHESYAIDSPRVIGVQFRSKW